MPERRRLPILKESAAEDEPTRSPWEWAFFGTVLVFAAWLPLAYGAGVIEARTMAARFGADATPMTIRVAIDAMSSGERVRMMAAMALPHLVGLALACFIGGLVVTRFGTHTTVRQAAVSGGTATVIASLLALFAPTPSWATLVTVPVGIAFATWGGRVGTKMRA